MSNGCYSPLGRLVDLSITHTHRGGHTHFLPHMTSYGADFRNGSYRLITPHLVAGHGTFKHRLRCLKQGWQTKDISGAGQLRAKQTVVSDYRRLINRSISQHSHTLSAHAALTCFLNTHTDTQACARTHTHTHTHKHAHTHSLTHSLTTPHTHTKTHTSTHSPVDAGDVDDHVDHVAAQLVGLHVYGGAVCGDVDLADHVKQEGLLDARILTTKHNPKQRLIRATVTIRMGMGKH